MADDWCESILFQNTQIPNKMVSELKIDEVDVKLPGNGSFFQPHQEGKLKLLVGTWNVGNAQPDEEQMKNWIPDGGGDFDMIIVGVQECSYSTKDDTTKAEMDQMLDEYTRDLDDLQGPTHSFRDLKAKRLASRESKEAGASEMPSAGGSRLQKERRRSSSILENVVGDDADEETAKTKIIKEQMTASKTVRNDKSHMHFDRLLDLIIGMTHARVAMQHGGPMRLCVFVRKAIIHEVTDVQQDSEYTGILHVGFNKGGLGISLNVGGTSLCFVSNHLAAHQEKVRPSQHPGIPTSQHPSILASYHPSIPAICRGIGEAVDPEWGPQRPQRMGRCPTCPSVTVTRYMAPPLLVYALVVW